MVLYKCRERLYSRNTVVESESGGERCLKAELLNVSDNDSNSDTHSDVFVDMIASRDQGNSILSRDQGKQPVSRVRNTTPVNQRSVVNEKHQTSNKQSNTRSRSELNSINADSQQKSQADSKRRKNSRVGGAAIANQSNHRSEKVKK